MNSCIKRRCGTHLLTLLNKIKECPLEREDVEDILTEMNRVIMLVEKYVPFPPVTQDHSDESRRVIGETILKINGTHREIEKTDVPGLIEYFPIVSNTPLNDLIEYLVDVQGNNICEKCLRRSSPDNLCPPLVQKRVGNVKLFYHICCQKE